MADTYKRQVRLADILPGANPRRDFGDIDELAAAIEATGGQPVNPPVVVADGNAFRLVDGERRVRALRRIHGEDGMADVLVFPNYDEAEEAVAMVATDAKQALSEQERARGFQRMLLLGVEERTVAKALRRNVGDVRKASKVARIAPEQATLDQMIAAAEFEDEADRKAVLSASADKFMAKAEGIRRRIASKDLAERFERKIAELGFDPEEKCPEDYVSIRTCYTPEELEGLVAEHEDEELAVWPCTWNSAYWMLGHKYEARVPSPEEIAERELLERQHAAVGMLRRALLEDIATTDVMPRMAITCGEMRAENYSWERDVLRGELVSDLGVREDLADAAISCPASTYEVLQVVCKSGYREWWKWVARLLPAAVEDGFQTSDEDEWLLEQAVAERDRRAAAGSEDGE